MARWILLVLLIGFAQMVFGQEIRAFWADGFSEGFKTPEQVDTLIRRLQTATCNAIFAQMRKSGDAYYLSRYEPWANDNKSRFDALAYLIEKAHACSPRIQVHAWINTCAVGRTYGNPFHIVEAHRDWLSISDTGEDYDNEATKIDPGHPDAADWTVRVYLDVVRNYDVDGVHFDFVRYGSPRFGFNPVSVARYNQRHGLSGQPQWNDPKFMAWRRDQVTNLVRKVYAMAYALDPMKAISAATITWGDGPHDVKGMTARQWWDQKSAPMNRVFQDWRAWMEEGILDLNCLMSYYQEAKNPDMFRHWIDWCKDSQYRRWAVPSSGTWFNSIPNIFRQIEAIRAPSAKGSKPAGVLLYCYAGTNLGEDGKEQRYNEEMYVALGSPSRYAERPPFEGKAEFPALPWKTSPAFGHLKGFVLIADGLRPVDGATVTVSGPRRRKILTDGTGFYAFIDLPPGDYKVTVSAPGFAPVTGKATVAKGQAQTWGALMGGAPTPYYASTTDLLSLKTGAPVRGRMVVWAGTDVFPMRLFGASEGGAAAAIQLAQRPILPFQAGDVVEFQGVLRVVDGVRVVSADAVRLVDMVRAPREVMNSEPAQLLMRPDRGKPIVTLAGKVVEVLADRFVIQNGQKATVMLAGRKEPWVEAPEEPLEAPRVGQEVTVTGALSLGDGLVVVRPRNQGDIVVK